MGDVCSKRTLQVVVLTRAGALVGHTSDMDQWRVALALAILFVTVFALYSFVVSMLKR